MASYSSHSTLTVRPGTSSISTCVSSNNPVRPVTKDGPDPWLHVDELAVEVEDLKKRLQEEEEEAQRLREEVDNLRTQGLLVTPEKDPPSTRLPEDLLPTPLKLDTATPTKKELEDKAFAGADEARRQEQMPHVSTPAPRTPSCGSGERRRPAPSSERKGSGCSPSLREERDKEKTPLLKLGGKMKRERGSAEKGSRQSRQSQSGGGHRATPSSGNRERLAATPPTVEKHVFNAEGESEDRSSSGSLALVRRKKGSKEGGGGGFSMQEDLHDLRTKSRAAIQDAQKGALAADAVQRKRASMNDKNRKASMASQGSLGGVEWDQLDPGMTGGGLAMELKKERKTVDDNGSDSLGIRPFADITNETSLMCWLQPGSASPSSIQTRSECAQDIRRSISSTPRPAEGPCDVGNQKATIQTSMRTSGSSADMLRNSGNMECVPGTTTPPQTGPGVARACNPGMYDFMRAAAARAARRQMELAAAQRDGQSRSGQVAMAAARLPDTIEKKTQEEPRMSVPAYFDGEERRGGGSLQLSPRSGGFSLAQITGPASPAPLSPVPRQSDWASPQGVKENLQSQELAEQILAAAQGNKERQVVVPAGCPLSREGETEQHCETETSSAWASYMAAFERHMTASMRSFSRWRMLQPLSNPDSCQGSIPEPCQEAGGGNHEACLDEKPGLIARLISGSGLGPGQNPGIPTTDQSLLRSSGQSSGHLESPGKHQKSDQQRATRTQQQLPATVNRSQGGGAGGGGGGGGGMPLAWSPPVRIPDSFEGSPRAKARRLLDRDQYQTQQQHSQNHGQDQNQNPNGNASQKKAVCLPPVPRFALQGGVSPSQNPYSPVTREHFTTVHARSRVGASGDGEGWYRPPSSSPEILSPCPRRPVSPRTRLMDAELVRATSGGRGRLEELINDACDQSLDSSPEHGICKGTEIKRQIEFSSTKDGGTQIEQSRGMDVVGTGSVRGEAKLMGAVGMDRQAASPTRRMSPRGRGEETSRAADEDEERGGGRVAVRLPANLTVDVNGSFGSGSLAGSTGSLMHSPSEDERPPCRWASHEETANPPEGGLSSERRAASSSPRNQNPNRGVHMEASSSLQQRSGQNRENGRGNNARDGEGDAGTGGSSNNRTLRVSRIAAVAAAAAASAAASAAATAAAIASEGVDEKEEHKCPFKSNQSRRSSTGSSAKARGPLGAAATGSATGLPPKSLSRSSSLPPRHHYFEAKLDGSMDEESGTLTASVAGVSTSQPGPHSRSLYGAKGSVGPGQRVRVSGSLKLQLGQSQSRAGMGAESVSGMAQATARERRLREYLSMHGEREASLADDRGFHSTSGCGNVAGSSRNDDHMPSSPSCGKENVEGGCDMLGSSASGSAFLPSMNANSGLPNVTGAQRDSTVLRESYSYSSAAGMESGRLKPCQNPVPPQQQGGQNGQGGGGHRIRPSGSGCRISPTRVEDRPIIAGLQDDMPGDATPLRLSPGEWDGRGIPNSTTKYREDQRVKYHATPFEVRLERKLAEEDILARGVNA
ncbi:hypothetical protein CBR_g3991 [Chara braunii]|uniref:Uncharacterized protein n=1 Tax=Chara braunii TaxID=69332 RepID=A0A388KGX3_CHABU|nr:hypothetical protein CBR_g3991 [Chara braunii]|eukprot:GBG69292.1 hypothetical protein CBR_g3991 [Chara braunii]